MITKIIIYPLLIVLNLTIIMLVGLPFLIDLIIFFIFFIIFVKNKYLFFTYNIFFLISIFFINIFVLDKTSEKKQSLNSHKKFLSENKYRKNINEIVNNPTGDLIALDTCTNSLANYKINKGDQKFVTDEFGYRNTSNAIIQSDYILVGNSIILGAQLSQNNILSEQLNSISKYKFSNIAIGGIGPKGYENNMLTLLPHLNDDQKFLLFYFEGNDFYFDKKNTDFYWYGIKISKYKYKLRFGYERLERNKDKILNKKIFNKNYLYQNIRPHSQRLYNKLLSHWTRSCLVEWKNINNKKVGFLYKYYELDDYKTYIIKNKNLLEKIEKVFFIPSKYSTYENYLNNSLSIKNRINKINFLKKEYKKLNIEVVNLTKELQKETDKEIKNGKFTYFQDDTHLNKLGIKILSKYILKMLVE